MRVFVGVPVPEALIGPCMRAQALIRGGRPVAAEDLHLTLAFVEDASDAGVEALHDELDARRLPAAKMRLEGVSSYGFPSSSIAARVADDTGLTALRDAAHGAVRRAGLVADAKRFRPHVTLARGKPDATRMLEAPPVSQAEPVTAVHLWQSQLRPGGSVYEILATYPVEARA